MTQSNTQKTVRVALGARSYDILVGPGTMAELGPRLSSMLKRPRVFVLTDETVGGLHRARMEDALKPAGIDSVWKAVPAGEATKNFAMLEEVLDWLLEHGADRSDCLIALGGGVIGDLTGLAASLMKRGMQFVQVPTTLLAQVDSSVGGKTAVNSPRGKNLIGQFYQPRLVIADTELLKTLPERELKAGYAEVVKYGLINDPDFFAWLETHGTDVLALKPEAITQAVAKSCEAKAAIVAEDETEKGVRALLNLGHTFGHALEAANAYRANLLHGEAVAIGMVLAFRYSARLGLAPHQDAERLIAHFDATEMPWALPQEGERFAPAHLVELMQQDKKAVAGRVPLILARGIGQSYVHRDADLESVKSFLEEEAAAISA